MMDYDLDGCITLADYQTWLQCYHNANDGAQNAPPLLAGDLNCDGVISYADINPFVQALSDQTTYETHFPDCIRLNADVNGDGVVSYADINPFVARLAGK
jgi:hypothetical protein